MSPSGSLWLAAKTLALWQWTILIWIDFSRRCLKKLDKKGLILLRKRLTLSGSNFGFPVSKLMRFFSKDAIERSFVLIV